MNESCPSCGSKNLVFRGKILPYDSFAGFKLEPAPQSSNLLKCLDCNLYFRWPRLPKHELDELYKKVSIDVWHYKNRKDWALTLKWIRDNDFAGDSILDVACWDGGFLDKFTGWDRYGIEINREARKRAISKNIHIIAEDVSDINKLSDRFDIITAFDFIEHTDNPLALISAIAKMTKRHGYIVVSSGNSEAFTARIMGEKYWYYAIPEHISFINTKWCEFVAERLNLQLIQMEKFSHEDERTLAKVITQLIHNVLFLNPTLYAWLKRLRNSFKKPERVVSPPWTTSYDHLLVIFRKGD